MQCLFTPIKINRFFQLLIVIAYSYFSSTALAVENSALATLQVNFPGLNSVHTEIRINDNIKNSASGNLVKTSNWKNDNTSVTVPHGHYDLIIKKGAGKLIVDNVDCTSGTCAVSNLTATLTVIFPKMLGVHTSVFVTDNMSNKISNQKVTHLNWKNEKAILTVLRQKYDLSVTKGIDTIILDGIDCRSGSCLVDNFTTRMTVNFPGINAVHTSVYAIDDVNGVVTGSKSFYKNWQSNQAILTVFKKKYDVSIRRKNASPLIVDNVDCRSGLCSINNIVSTLTVNFPGMSSIHTSVHQVDGQAGSATGREFAHKNWQKGQAKITVFKQKYDVSIKSNRSDPIIKDSIDCTSGSCSIDQLTATLTVKFPNMAGVHTSVLRPDGKIGTADGETIFHLNWQKDQAKITVFKQKYDVSIRRNSSAPMFRDNIDCTTGSCTIDQLTATLTVKFPNMSGIHTSVHIPDGIDGTVAGKQAFNRNWQKNQAVIYVFKQKYDVSIKGNSSAPILKDNIDCTTGSCVIDHLTATLTVKFPNMSGIHTSVHIPDGTVGAVGGKKAFSLNWQKDQAKITVFRQAYDISVNTSNASPMIIDTVNCISGSCLVDNLTALLTVNFPKLSSVHTSVHVPDNLTGQASGGQFTQKNWQKNKAIISVFKQKYDVKVKKGPISKVIDNIDCSSGICSIKDLISTLTIDFPGLKSVHSSAHIPDSINNKASGTLVSKSNWKKNTTTITLLREKYDVKVDHGINTFFDNVDCSNITCKVLITGNVQATLIDGDSNNPIAGEYMTAYEKSSDGTLKKIMSGKTTALGQINYTLPGLTTGKTYVLKVYSPFGNSKSYSSPIIQSEGAFKFIITVNGENSLDVIPPTVNITSLQNGGNVTSQGFVVTGSATDNRQIDRVELTVTDPVKGSQTILSTYDKASQSWIANVADSLISINNDIVLSATAFDLAQSQHTATVTVSVIKDTLGPETNISSHIENDQIPATGFLLSGTVTDLTGIATLKATLIDSVLGTTITNKDVGFSMNNGTWTLVVNNGLMTENGAVDITLNATDSLGNSSSKTIHLLVVAVDYSNTHMINRITFGATPQLIQEVASLGALTFLDQQLDPNSIDDINFTSTLGNLPATKEQLQAWTLKHMAFSNRQLLEVMTWFWDNHFNTNIKTKRKNAQGVELSNTVQYELAENQAFRSNALGNFRDLLGISAKSPAMLIYLDSISNVAGDSNENYAREVDELHSLGVDGGYTSTDVENGAEIFTGWHIQNGAFFFDSNQHTTGSYTMFEGTPEEAFIPQGGVSQGEQLLDMLASHPSTAKFICTKLIRVFVNDTPPASLVSRCSAEFINSNSANNQIERVVRLIMQSAEFNDPAQYRSKIKTPVEFVIGAIRNLEATSDARDLLPPIQSMGIRLYENPVPTGWSEIGADWINASLLLERMKWINSFTHNSDINNSSSNPMQFYPNNLFGTADGIVGFLLQLTVGDDFTPLAQANALNILGPGFDLSNIDAESKLRQLNGIVMSYPQYQFQ